MQRARVAVFAVMSRSRLAQNLRDYRLLRKQSQRKLAEKSGIALKTIRNIEAGDHSPTYDTLERLARALEITVSMLTDDPSARSPTTRWLRELRDLVASLPPTARRKIVSFTRALQQPPPLADSSTS